MTDKASILDWQRLQLADFGNATGNVRPGSASAQNRTPSAASKKEQEQAQGFQKGYEEGLNAGRAEGLATGEATGKAAGQQAAQKLLSLSAILEKKLLGLDQQIAEEILALSLEVARQVLRQEIANKPETILPVVREALSQLPHQHAAIYLHPEDAALVRMHSGDQFSHAGHRIHEDPALRRGDAVIEAGGAQVDATLATRWRRIVENLGSETSWNDSEEGRERG